MHAPILSRWGLIYLQDRRGLPIAHDLPDEGQKNADERLE
jgi:hypothetical protein